MVLMFHCPQGQKGYDMWKKLYINGIFYSDAKIDSIDIRRGQYQLTMAIPTRNVTATFKPKKSVAEKDWYWDDPSVSFKKGWTWIREAS